MTAYDRETVQVIEYRWLLRLPADHTDVAQAFNHASRHWEERSAESPSSLLFTAEDEHLVISYTVRTPGTFTPSRIHTADGKTHLVVKQIQETAC